MEVLRWFEPCPYISLRPLHLRKHVCSQILADKQAIGPDHSTVTWAKTRAGGEAAQEKLSTGRDSASFGQLQT